MEAQFAVISSKYVKLSFNYVRCVAASGPRSVVTGSNFVPMVRLYIEYVHIVHPVHAIVATEVIDFAINEASSGAHTGAWLHSSHLGLYPGEGGCV